MAVYAGKEGPNIQLAIPALPRLAHKALQPLDGGLRAPAFAVGVAVVNKALVPPRFDVPYEPLVYQSVAKGRRKNLAQLGVGDGKHRERLRRITPLGNGLGLRQNQRRQVDEVCALVLAVARVCGAGKELAGNVGAVLGVCQGVCYAV